MKYCMVFECVCVCVGVIDLSSSYTLVIRIWKAAYKINVIMLSQMTELTSRHSCMFSKYVIVNFECNGDANTILLFNKHCCTPPNKNQAKQTLFIYNLNVINYCFYLMEWNHKSFYQEINNFDDTFVGNCQSNQTFH